MIRTIFFILITCVVLALGGFLLKDKLGLTSVESFNINSITGAFSKDKQQNNEPATKQRYNTDKKQTNDNATEVYFVKVSDNDKIKFSATPKKVKNQSEKFRNTMEILFSGPSGLQKLSGVYSEIPPNTKLLGIKEDATSYTINISDDFETGGGADSMQIRVNQLVTTATQASGGKDVYLEINGKRAEYVGGEGIIILQPLQRNLDKTQGK